MSYHAGSTNFDQTLQALTALCASLQPGARIPTHKELMRRYEASERTVLRALDELQRSGRVVRRRGAGTFVVDRAGAPVVDPVLVDRRTLVAVTRPDCAFYDRCMDFLFRHLETQDLDLVCRVVDPATTPVSTPPPADTGPLGYLFFRYELAPLARRFRDAGCRVALVGAPPAGAVPGVPCIYGDHEQGGYLAASHLLELGHRRIGFAGGRSPRETLRWCGHQRALREARRRGAALRESVLASEEIDLWTREPALAAEYFRGADAPSGIVVWNDHDAVKLLTVLTRAGIRVPEDVSLVGYDALPEGQRVCPPLTTVDQGIARQLHAALNLLTQPGQPSPEYTVVVLPALISRMSCAPPPEA